MNWVRLAARAGLGAIAVAVMAGSAAGEVQVGWKGGTFVKDPGKGYEIKFGGRIQNDWSAVWADDSAKTNIPGITDGTLFRRVRFFSSGVFDGVVEYKLQLDFAGGAADFKDVYMGVRNVPALGTIRVGHQFEPMGLETMTSSKSITFIERSVLTALTPERRSGFLFERSTGGKRMSWSAGAFVPSGKTGGYEGRDWAVTGRVTGLAVDDEDANTFVHLGASARFRQANSGSFDFGTRPENPVLPEVVSTNAFLAENAIHFGGEAVAVRGPLSVQGEAMAVSVKSDSTGNPTFNSFYVQATWTLTGESRGYKSENGTMGTIDPARRFDGKGGKGAWEIAARVSNISLKDGTVDGGEMTQVTGALNWYLNGFTRIQFNYNHADIKNAGKINSFIARFQIAF